MPIFGASLFLLSAAFIVVPLALHLLHKRKPQIFTFGAFRFLKQAIEKTSRAHRITQSLTLIMRVLLLLLLALAFAKPMVNRGFFTQHGQRTLLVVLDGSASMQAKEGDITRFDAGKLWLTKLVDSLEAADQVALLVASNDKSIKIAHPLSDKKQLLEQLENAACCSGAVDLPTAIVQLLQEGSSDLHDLEIHAFSDFQNGSWSQENAAVLADEMKKQRCTLFCNKVGTDAIGDASILKAEIFPKVLFGNNKLTCQFQLGYSPDYTGTVSVFMTQDTQECDRATLSLPAEDSTGKLTALSDAADAFASGSITLDDDAYPLNNTRFYSVPRLKNRPALLIDGESTENRNGFFLEKALRPNANAFSYIQPEVKDWAGLQNTPDLAQYAMVFLCNPPVMDATLIDTLRQYASRGGVLVLFPGNQNGVTTEALRTLTGSTTVQVSPVKSPKPLPVKITLPPGKNDAFRQRLQDMLPPPWAFSQHAKLKLEDPQAINGLAYDQSSDKKGIFLWRRNVGSGECIALATSANRDWSDCPLSPFFFVLVQELSRHGAGFHTRDVQTTVGGEVSLDIQGELQTPPKTLLAKAPDGRKVELPCSANTAGRLLTVQGFAEPGLYTLELPWNNTAIVAVNLPPSEIDLNPTTEEACRKMLPGIPLAFSTRHEELLENILSHGQKVPLAPALLIVAFFLAMLEVIYANIRSKAATLPDAMKRVMNS